MKDLVQHFARLSPAKQALLIQQLQSKLEAQERLQVEPIAIIGMSCRFPGDARNPQSFWKFLSDGGDAIIEVPPDRWDWRVTSDSEPITLGKINTRWGGFLPEVADFDAQAFGLSPREAERMDPQQRLLLELAWEALEDAGVAIERLRATQTGVFIGCSYGEYGQLQLGQQSRLDALVGTGSAPSMAASRISYSFDLRGPSLVIDTACSSSLVAAHVACQSLRRGESTLALVGGVNVILMPEPHIIFSKAGLLAPDGRCKVFDERADGYVRSEGAGLIVLKPLSRALADGDSIYAVIRGSAVNQDGRSNGITAPNRQAQESVLREAYRDAGISPGEIQYVEAHGTGTALGDLIEAQALGTVLSADRPHGQSCLIGSVKSNIGHLESAAGIAGLIKVALALKHKEIPPSLHFERPNQRIPFDALSLRVAQKLTPWPEGAIPARAGVSAFSFGGTNAHLVLEESPLLSPSSQSRSCHVLMLSAKTSSALESVTTNLINHLKQNPDRRLADMAYTLQTGRSFYNHRRMVVCRSVTEATDALDTLDPVKVFTTVTDASGRPVVFMFPGLGEHYVNMAGGLYQAEPIFRSEVDGCCEYLKSSQGLDLKALLFGAPGPTNEAVGLDLRGMLRRGTRAAAPAETELNRTEVAQPAVFVIEYALAKWLMKLGVRPQAMIGHSLGEYVAACVAGVFSLADGLRLVSERARLIGELPCGVMLAVAMGEAEVESYLGAGVSLAAVNGPQMCVLSGAEAEMEEVERKLEESEVAARRLPTRHAFHSEQMREIAERFRRLWRDVELRSPEIPYVSNVTGKWIRDEEARSAEYWERHLCETVRFGDGVRELLSAGERVMVEVGPGQSLSSFVKLHPECGPEQAGLVVASLRAESESGEDEWYWKRLMGKLWLTGVELDWKGLYEGERRSRVPLPTYPFERQRYWIEASRVEPERVERRGGVSRKAEVKDWFYRLGWREREFGEWSESEVESGREGGWLVFLDDEEEGLALMRRLEERGCEVVSVKRGERFARLSENEYVIDGRESGDYQALIEELSREGKSPREIVHLWNVGWDRGAKCESERFEREQERGFYSLMYLAQALEEQKEPAEIQITVISSGVQRVTGRERLCPAKATLLGPCKVIPQEYLTLRCRSVDLSDEEKSVDVEGGIWDRVMEECLRRSTDVVIAYRDGKRYAQSVEQIRDEEMREGKGRLREGGVYLITGGLGEIGMTLAEYLGKSAHAKLVLVGRSAFPERENWDEWLESHGAEDEVSGKIVKLRKLEEQGAEALVVSADVGNEEEMRRAVKMAEERFGELAGVIHGAGIVTPDAFMAMRNLNRSECERHFHPKARGVQVIEKLLRGRNLDFCLLLSSLSSLWGGLGSVAYTAASIFLDSMAQQPLLPGNVPWLSVNLDAWQPLRKEDGLSNSRIGPAAFGMAPAEGMQVFHRIFNTNLGAQVAVSSADLQARIDQWSQLESLRTIKRTTHPRPVLGTAYVEPSNEMESRITKIWQELLGLDRVGVEDNFFELGGHSLLATQLFSRLRAEFDVEISVRNIFEMATVTRQAELIATIRWATRASDLLASSETPMGAMIEGEL